MSPRIQRLRAEIASDLGAYTSLIDELAGLPPLTASPRATLAQAAVALHHAYGAVESALARISRVLEDFRRLLGFRHFFRHAYAVDLDGARLEELRQLAVSSRTIVLSDLTRFDATLAALAGSGTSGSQTP